jgi:hypothetical protein
LVARRPTLVTEEKEEKLLADLKELARPVQQEALSYERRLLGLVRRKVQEGRQRLIERLLQREKTWSALELKRLPTNVLQQGPTLLEGPFLGRREKVLAFGVPGWGKTPLSAAVAWRWCGAPGRCSSAGWAAGGGAAGGEAGPEAETGAEEAEDARGAGAGRPGLRAAGHSAIPRQKNKKKPGPVRNLVSGTWIG